jgi:hypothetical protein
MLYSGLSLFVRTASSLIHFLSFPSTHYYFCSQIFPNFASSTIVDYQNKHYSIDQKDEGRRDYQGRGGGTNFILRIKEQDNNPNPSGT